MNRKVFDQWTTTVSRCFHKLFKPQIKALGEFSYGVFVAEHCQLRKIANALPGNDSARKHERRLAYFLGKCRLSMPLFFECWTRWCLRQFAKKGRIELAVDETEVGKHCRAMVVALVYKCRAIPLMWFVYKKQDKDAYPIQGQVKMILQMLERLKAWLPASREVVVMADRGIGNSPDLCKGIAALNCFYLLRLPHNVKMFIDGRKVCPRDYARKGKRIRLRGRVFVSKGRVPAQVWLCWNRECKEPWILITNHPKINPLTYRFRGWIEQCFRDQKSYGWQLADSHVKCPDRMTRLLTLLALTTGLAIDMGRYVRYILRRARKRRNRQGRQTGYIHSVFQEGKRFVLDAIRRGKRLPSTHFMAPQAAP